MEIEVRTAKVIKKGTSDKGAWELIKVTTPDGTEYTTFDKKAKHQDPGAVIDIGEPKIEKGKISFEKIVRVVREGQPASGARGSDYKADPVKLASEELRSRMHAGVQLLVAGIYKRDEPLGKLVESWIIGKKTTGPTKKAPQTKPAPSDQPEAENTDLRAIQCNNLQDLFTNAYKHLHINQTQVLEKLGLDDKSQIANAQDSWLELVDKMEKGA
jgi:hypothetical protein